MLLAKHGDAARRHVLQVHPSVTSIVVGPSSWCALDVVAAILHETLPPEVTLLELAAGTPSL